MVDAGKKRRYLTLDDVNERVVTCDYRELKRECKLRHAWARTIHTFQVLMLFVHLRPCSQHLSLLHANCLFVFSLQGSESETIVYVLGDSIAQNWQHVYTAVTRGQKRVYVVGTESDLEGAIKKWITPRNTRLCWFVKSTVAKQGPEDSLTQYACSQSQVETPVNHRFGPSQSTPVAPHCPSLPQSFSSTKPSCIRHLYKEENGQNHQTSNISLQDDMAFSKTYSWSPMDGCDEPSMVQNEHVSELSNQVEDSTLLETISSSPNESSRGSKRLIPVDTCSTPTKLPKVTCTRTFRND